MRPSVPALLLLLALFLGSAIDAQAQIRHRLNFDFIVGLPQGEFKNHVDNPGFGLSAFWGLPVERTPVVVGLDAGILIYGLERRFVPFSTTIPDVTVVVETRNSIAMGHLVLRLQPQQGSFQPYVDGLVGFKYLFTESEVQNNHFFEREGVVSSTNFDDFAVSYGLGGGLDVAVYRDQRAAFKINAGVRYLLGSTAEYLVKGAIDRSNGRAAFISDRSETNLLTTQLGVSIWF